MKLALALALLATPLLDVAPASRTAPPPEDEAGVRAALEYYLRGHATGHADTMARAFHPDAELKFIRNGAYTRRPVAEYLAGFRGTPAANEAQRVRRIVRVEITGAAAVATLELDHVNALLTDYMHLLKVDGEWKIVHKIFHAAPK